MSYEPYRTHTVFPGHISEQRQEQLHNFQFDVTDITGDDLTWLLSKAVAGTAYSALRFVRDKFGQEAAQELSRQFGYEAGVAIFNRYRDRLGLSPGEPLSTEQFAEFQDYAHAVMGVDAAYSFAGYDDDKAWVSRQRCFSGGSSPYTNAPPDLEDVCAYSDLGFISAYKEIQPTLKWENTHNMADRSVTSAAGGAICGSVFWMDWHDESGSAAAGDDARVRTSVTS